MRYVVDEFHDDLLCVLEGSSKIDELLAIEQGFRTVRLNSSTHDYFCYENDTIFKIPKLQPFGCTIIEELDFHDAYWFKNHTFNDAEEAVSYIACLCGKIYYDSTEDNFTDLVEYCDSQN